MAYSSKVASGPRMTSTLSCSMSSCALVLAPAGLPPVSAENSSTFRPPIMALLSFRNVNTPCSIWTPPCASGPVFTVRSPTLIDGDCAIAGAGKRPSAAVAPAATVPRTSVRRLNLRVIVFPPDALSRFNQSMSLLRRRDQGVAPVGGEALGLRKTQLFAHHVG